MSALDWLLLGIVTVSAVLGLVRGLVGVLASLAAWLLGGWAAMSLGGPAARLLAGTDTPGGADLVAGYGGCFLAVAATVTAVAWLTRRLLHWAGLGPLDRGLGLALGTLRGGLVGSAVVLLLGFTAVPGGPQWQGSPVLPWFMPGAQWLSHWLPDWAVQRLDLDGRVSPPADLAPPA